MNKALQEQEACDKSCVDAYDKDPGGCDSECNTKIQNCQKDICEVGTFEKKKKCYNKYGARDKKMMFEYNVKKLKIKK